MRSRVIGWLAFAVSAAYGILGTWWSLGGSGYPFGPVGDPQPGLSILGEVPASMGAPAIAVAGALSAVVAVLMIRGALTPSLRRVLPLFGVGVAIVAAGFIPDYRILVAVAYAPIFVIGAPFGLVPADASFFDAVSPTVLHQLAIMCGGVAWLGLAVDTLRRNARSGWLVDPAAATRWGRWATLVAVVIPIVYAATRFAWALGIPLGVSEDFLRQGAGSSMWQVGAALGSLAVVGALLTTGLALRWGESFPGWLPVIGGRSVPVGLAVVPALLVAAMVTSAGTMFVRLILAGTDFGGLGEFGALAPEVLWPAWGVALAVAAIAYGLRRSASAPRFSSTSPSC